MLFRHVIASGNLGPVQESPVPVPCSGEVLLRVHATSINYHDLIGVNGGIPGLTVPRVPFSDACGTIEAVGEGVEGWTVGERVLPSFFLDWADGRPNRASLSRILGDQVDGALQTHLVVPARILAKAPQHLSHIQAATLCCAGLTAWRAIMVEAQIQRGQTVLLLGTGGVSLFGLAFARLSGAQVIITSSSDEKLSRARELGADVTINYRKDVDWAKRVIEHTGGEGADLVIEVGGGGTLAQSIRAARVDGHVSVIGVLSGRDTQAFPAAAVMAKNLTVRGITVGSTADLRAMCAAVENAQITPIVDSVYDLETAHEALEAMAAQQHFGKIAVTMP